jgi:hypothetical protein
VAEEVTRAASLRAPSSAAPAPGPRPVPRRTEARIAALRGAGRPLPEREREHFEARFGRDLGAVRLHDGPTAAAAARELNARAFTLGADIVFAPGELRLGSGPGRRLLAHELTHTLQQGASREARTLQREPGPLGDFELELDPAFTPVPSPNQSFQLAPPTLGFRRSRPQLLTPALSLEPPVLRQMREWIEQRIRHWNRRIDQRTRDYAARGWRLAPSDLADFNRRIRQLETLRDDLDDALPPLPPPQLAASNPLLGLWLTGRLDDVLRLANVVVNEAGVSNPAAKQAVAYAYLNRTGGVVREPTGAEISGYRDLPTRWAGLNDTQRLTLLENFIPSVRAARARLEDLQPATTDPTGGATHWVSPIGLSVYNAAVHGTSRYSRTVGSAHNRAFPTWARDPSSAEVTAMQAAGQLDADYDEIQVAGVPREQFLFYRGVR